MNQKEAIEILGCRECLNWADEKSAFRKKMGTHCYHLPKDQMIEKAQDVKSQRHNACGWKILSFPPEEEIREESDLQKAIFECTSLTPEGICTVPYRDGKLGACAFAPEDGALLLAAGIDPKEETFRTGKAIIVTRFPMGKGKLPKEAKLKKTNSLRSCPGGFVP